MNFGSVLHQVKNRDLFSLIRNAWRGNGMFNFYCQQAVTTEDRRDEKLSLEAYNELLTTSDRRAKIKEIINEYYDFRNCSHRVPTSLRVEDMSELLCLSTRNQRKVFLSYLYTIEKRKLLRSQKRLEKMQEQPTDSSATKKLSSTTFLRHMRKSSVIRFRNVRLAYASLFGQKLVIDLGYDEFMLRREIKNSIKQLNLLCSTNRRDRNPFDMYVCNVKSTNYSMQCLQKDIPRFGKNDCLDTFTECSYLDLFPKEKLIYLSPHASETMKEYDPSAVYIIGAFVDLTSQWKISSEKAEKDGIRSLSLPLDDYFDWCKGSKCLSINQVFEILLHLKNTGDWNEALKLVPRRKLKMNSPKTDKETDDADSELINPTLVEHMA